MFSGELRIRRRGHRIPRTATPGEIAARTGGVERPAGKSMLDAGLLFVFLMAILFILLSTGGDRSESGMGAPIPSVDHPVDETIAPPPPRR